MEPRLELHDQPAFFELLNAMGTFFHDELSERVQHIYWELFAERCNLDEWQWACLTALSKHDYYKVPLAAHLWEFIREYRVLKADARKYRTQQDRARDQQKMLDNPPFTPEEMQTQMASLFGELDMAKADRDRFGRREPAYSQPIDETEVAARRALLQQQLERLKEEHPDR